MKISRILLSLFLILQIAGCNPGGKVDSEENASKVLKEDPKLQTNNVYIVSEEKEKVQEISDQTTYEVIRVIDGDTFIVDFGGKEERVRLIGIDTPEITNGKNQPFGQEAYKYTKKLVEGQKVKLEFDVGERDKYGRILAYVYIKDVFINATLLEQGLAKVMTVPPNIKHSDLFVSLQKEARKEKVGIWKE